MRRAFISHSTADDRYSVEMESFLRTAGFDEVFNDGSAICPDEQIWPEIEIGIASCDSFVVVITAASNASEWVRREVEYARRLSKNVIPVRIEDCPCPPMFEGRDVIELWQRSPTQRQFEFSRILKYAPAELIGRSVETDLLNDAWQQMLRMEPRRPRVLTFVALVGEGKTSLVAKWAAGLADHDRVGCDTAFAWSFHSQSDRKQLATSSDVFLREALNFFGDETDRVFAASAADAYEKGRHLARIVGRRRSLLILDGLDPLQYVPTSPVPGQLRDRGIAALLVGLVTASHGLCVVTTRYSLPDLQAFWQGTAQEVKLPRLSRANGVRLLQSVGVKGSLRRNIPFHNGMELVNEFEKLVEDLQGHALTLHLLGTFLRYAHAGDIRKRDLVKLEKADVTVRGGHAFRVMNAYVCAFKREGDQGRLALAVLSLLGLFDRPITSDCLEALLEAPAIPGLTEPLVGSSVALRNMAFKRLEDAKLITVNHDASGTLVTLEAHPLLHEYFAFRLKNGSTCTSVVRKWLHRLFPRISATSPVWRAAHLRVYRHLCASTRDQPKPTLEDLQPLYQAVAHGCEADLQQDARDNIYRTRIERGQEFYGTWKLGAFGCDLEALSCFFRDKWHSISPRLDQANQLSLLNEAGYSLRVLGRLSEAREAMLAAESLRCADEEAADAAKRASNFSGLELLMGNVARAVETGKKGVKLADQSKSIFQRSVTRARLADSLHQAGRLTEAEACFRESEELHARDQPAYPLMYALRGFQYCELLLMKAERAAWLAVLSRQSSARVTGKPLGAAGSKEDVATCIASCQAVSERADKTLGWMKAARKDILSVSLDLVTLGRTAIYEALLTSSNLELSIPYLDLDAAVTGVRSAGQVQELPRVLLTRAWLYFLNDKQTGPESAHEDLNEAWEIARRGPMKLFLADIHLYRARLFGEAFYPWESPQADLVAAGKLIKECGYHRRDEQLVDAKLALESK